MLFLMPNQPKAKNGKCKLRSKKIVKMVKINKPVKMQYLIFARQTEIITYKNALLLLADTSNEYQLPCC